MGRRSPLTPGSVAQLLLRGRRPQTLVETEEDWLALGAMAERMLFWCGGSILGVRCERNEIRFAVQLGYASVGAMAHHLSAAYGTRMRRERGWRGPTFRLYRVIPLDDDSDLDDLVLWLHRPSEGHDAMYTAEAAYLKRSMLSWIDPLPVLRAMSVNASPAAYQWRKSQPMAASFVRAARSRRRTVLDAPPPESPPRPTMGAIARAVADHCGVALEDMRSDSRKRAAAKAKTVATVLATRNGATVAAAARYFNRNRSTLSEQAERYRITQPELFTKAETALEAWLERDRVARE